MKFRVNVGKSTLVNQLMQLQRSDSGHDVDDALIRGRRVVTGPTPGLTRDAIRLTLDWQPNKTIQVIDTAGIRKVSSYSSPYNIQQQLQSSPHAPPSDKEAVWTADDAARLSHVERMAIQEAFHSCKTADVVALVIDAGAKVLQRSELAMCDAILTEGRALVVVANKMDLVVEAGYSSEEFARDVREQLESRFPLLRKTPVVPLSALSGHNVSMLLPAVWDARERWQREIPTSQLNRWIREVQELHSRPSTKASCASSARGVKKRRTGGAASTAAVASPGSAQSKRVKIKYMIQTKGRPPTFLLYCNTTDLPDSYVRFLTRHFQDTFQLYGMPVRMAVKKSANPYLQERKNDKKKKHQ
jgi:GTP-binding protein